MDYSKLATVLRDRADTMQENQNDPDRLDNAELMRVLARICEGKEIHKSFGAPGDWGYGRPIGDALKEAYSCRSNDKLRHGGENQ